MGRQGEGQWGGNRHKSLPHGISPVASWRGFGYGAPTTDGEMAERFKARAWKACWG